MEYKIRNANVKDITCITNIYNQGIEDRIATLETRLREDDEMSIWLSSRDKRHKVIVIEDINGNVKGWASLNVFNSRCCYSGVGDLSIYIERDLRGKGLGKLLLSSLLEVARENDFHKLTLSTFDYNERSKRLYKSLGFREVGTYINQGILDGKFVNITIMEKLL
ncbi:arsinothricin resistance N-acetyltransferase ArsN1 [Clostridium swellfunianum]|uniref:arsinothricin resistance N-acetyltransferase ArsN1 family A n=1 Tax=Clostridium swellfunianum TaxID=1367462 RepID=UPI0020302401|nr:arsinothricin resistance N-acetyltransferase ArsN1 family A [Clostridium swellfunianum]MCM0647285.1 arsinothricin resistance N-acetyltransferase ArsN1 [Clostridium swellfunianum]